MTIAFLGLACFLTWLSYKRKEMLLAMCASLTWFAEAMWLFFSEVPLFDIAEVYAKILVWVFFIMAFVPWLFQMDVEITNEREGTSWKEWGAKPKDKATSYEKYARELRRRTRG